MVDADFGDDERWRVRADRPRTYSHGTSTYPPGG
jgi:hypothetical protein